jgi:hypothetical protein
MPGTPESVVYELTVASADRQTNVLRDLRGRAATIFSAASLSTAFLGGQALGDGHSFTALALAAVVAYGFVGALIIVILWPWPWLSQLSAQVMLEDIDAEKLSEADVHRFLAGFIDKNIDSNQRVLDRLFWVYRASCVALVLDVVLWLSLLTS